MSATNAIRRLLPTQLPTAAHTDACGAALGRALRGGVVVTLEGELGAGKTALVRAALRARGITGAIKSPTYAIVESYPLNETLSVHHMDFYRLEHPLAWQEAGLAECFGGDTAVFIEWPSKGYGLPVADVAVNIAIELDGTRVLHATANSDVGQRLIDEWLTA